MSREFKLPELGEDVDEVEVLKVLVKPGDTVEREQTVLELETDKATIEVPVDVAGKIEEVKVGEGDRVRVGDVVLVVSASDDDADDEGEAEASNEERPPEKESPPDEDEGETGDDGDEDAGGGGREAEDDEARQERVEEPNRERDDDGTDEPAVRPTRSSTANVPAAPSVRRLARELGVDIAGVEGTGPGGRISSDDVKASARAIVSAGGAAPPTLPDFGKWGALERKRMSGLRRAVAANLSRSWNQIPHVTQHDVADITALDGSLKRYQERVEKAGGKLTITAVAVYVAAKALGKFPTFNASIDVARGEIVYKKYRHIGVAVDTERGLLVPVVRHADAMSVTEIAINITALAERARSGKLSSEQMEGGSFTITNLGGIGGTSFTPVVNWPEVAILGLARARHEPRWHDGELGPRLMLPLSLSYDHRIIDGADAARFLRFVAEAFSDPFTLMLEGGGG